MVWGDFGSNSEIYAIKLWLNWKNLISSLGCTDKAFLKILKIKVTLIEEFMEIDQQNTEAETDSIGGKVDLKIKDGN